MALVSPINFVLTNTTPIFPITNYEFFYKSLVVICFSFCSSHDGSHSLL